MNDKIRYRAIFPNLNSPRSNSSIKIKTKKRKEEDEIGRKEEKMKDKDVHEKDFNSDSKLEKRRLPDMKDLADLIKEKKIKKILVMAGAGISTSVGIPDFRTPGTGLYSNLEKYNLPYPEAIFQIEYFFDKPEPFYTLTKELYPGKFKPSLTHYFIRLLELKGLLKRVFTQNIDTLERISGISDDLIVEAHGSFATSTCLNCKSQMTTETFLGLLGDNGNVVRCPKARCKSNPRALVKPDIVFFGEGLPTKFFDHLTDFKKADLLIVIGTSLNVQPFASLIDTVPENCPRILINLEKVGELGDGIGFDFDGIGRGGREFVRDVLYLGKSDDAVLELCEELGWTEDLLALQKSFRKPKGRFEAENEEYDQREPKPKNLNYHPPVSGSASTSKSTLREDHLGTDSKIEKRTDGDKANDDLVDCLTKSIEKVSVSEKL